MIGVIVLVILIWGPQKIPELAKSLGQAKHELEKASKGDYEDRKKQQLS